MKQITISGHTATVSNNGASRYGVAFEDKANNGKYLSVSFTKCANRLYTKAWVKAGLTKTELPSWWAVDVYANDTPDYKEGKYAHEFNPTTFLPNNKHDFAWTLEATEENAKQLLEEIVKRAYGSEPLQPETDGGLNVAEQPQELSPMMKQYRDLKSKHPDAVLLFRVGGFYETYNEDAETISKILGVTLMKRDSTKCWCNRLAGFPAHALDKYLPKLTKTNHRVAICDQL